MSQSYFSKENLDHALYELAKVFQKMSGNKAEVEVTLVGGAAIIAEYHFRESTTDIDAFYRAPTLMKDAISKVGDANNFPRGWINDDFKNTKSYSDKIPLYSKPYKTFCHILKVRIMPPEYLVAMKLVALREYKHDRSDIIGIISESEVKKEDVETAFLNLYGKWEYLEDPSYAAKFLEDVYATSDKEMLYQEMQRYESEGFRILEKIDKNYDILNKDNVNDIIAQARTAQQKRLRIFLNKVVEEYRHNASSFDGMFNDKAEEYRVAADYIERYCSRDNISTEECIQELEKTGNVRLSNVIDALKNGNIDAKGHNISFKHDAR